MNAQETTDLLWSEYIYEQNKARQEKQSKLYAYYIGDEDELKSYLESALSLTYDSNDIAEMQLQFINFTKKLVNQLAVIYKEQPTRYLVNEAGKEQEDATKYYESILPVDLATKDKTAHRYGKLYGTSLTQVYFDFDKKKIQYKVHPSQNISVDTDDEDTQVIKDLRYDKYYNNELFTVVWTDEEHFKINQYGQQTFFEGDENGVNPFGVIPFARFICEQSEGLWGEGQTDAVNVNEQINLLLTKLISRDIILGTEGVLFAVNCGLKTKGKSVDSESDGVKKVRLSVKHPLVVEDVRTDMVTPSLEHVSVTAQIEAIKNTIDWYIKLIALTKGLNPNSFLAETQATSGYSKIIDSLEQLEFRQDDLESARIFEQERFEITRKVVNYYASTQEGKAIGLKPIDEKLSLVVDFAEIEIQKTPQEIREDRTFAWENNLSTPIDALMEDNPDLDHEAAEEQIMENKTYNDSLKKQKTLFESLINKNNGVNTNEQIAQQ